MTSVTARRSRSLLSKARNYQSNPNRKEFYCKEHGPNSTHDSSDCKVIHGKQANKDAWKNKDKSENKYSHYKSKSNYKCNNDVQRIK
jgi:hypothetical protein